jgi:hypothetical protein
MHLQEMERSMSLQEMERLASDYIQRGEVENTPNYIFDLIVAFAKNKDFDKANAWRSKLMEFDPTQLALIYDSAEIIEAEKATAIDPAHEKLWKSLYETLTKFEGQLLYQKMKQRDFPANKVLIQQGKLNNTLFFVDKGKLRTTFRAGERESFFNNLDEGDTAGQDTFFNISVCTHTVATASPTKIRYLSRSSLHEMENEVPGISKKLEETCLWLESKSPNAAQNRPTQERRQHERHVVSAKITAQTFDKMGEPIRPMYSGWLADISIGGAAFIIDYSDKNIGRSLLGRMTALKVRFKKGSQIDLKGRILGAKHDNYHAYTINMKFSEPVDSALLENILARNAEPPQA